MADRGHFVSGYVLTATLFIRKENGRPVRYRRGDVIGGLTEADVARLLAAAAIAPAGLQVIDPPAEDDGAAGAAGTVLDGDVADTDPDTPAVVGRPKQAQSVEVWRAYARTQGIADAENLTKKQIQEALR